MEDEETQYNEKEYVDKIHELIGKVTQYQQDAKVQFEDLKQEEISSERRLAALSELKVMNDELMTNFESVNC